MTQFEFFALAFGSMIGVGWVTAVGGWLEQAGPLGAILAFVFGGAIMICIGLCYAEATPMLPVAGGEVAYAYLAFGPFKSFVVGWSLAFGYIAISGFEAISIGKVLGYMFPDSNWWLLYHVAGDPVYGSHLALGLLFTGLITWLHYRGIESAAAFQRWLTIGFVLVTFFFIAAGVWGGTTENLAPLFPVADSVGAGGVIGGILMVLVTVPFWFVGFDTIPQAAEEADVSMPPGKFALLIVGSIAAAIMFYIVLIISVGMIAPWPSIVQSDLPAARAFEAAFSNRLVVNLVLTAALLGLFTSWNGFFLAGSRVLFSLGRGRLIPTAFGETHPLHGTPYRAVLLTGLLTLMAPLMGRQALLSFVNAGSFCIGIAFLGVALSVMTLRRTHPHLARPFRLPGGSVIPGLAAAGALFLVAVMVWPGSPAALSWPREFVILGVLTILGGWLWFAGRAARVAVTEAERTFLILEHYGDPPAAS
jgi:amino acid transporter